MPRRGLLMWLADIYARGNLHFTVRRVGCLMDMTAFMENLRFLYA